MSKLEEDPPGTIRLRRRGEGAGGDRRVIDRAVAALDDRVPALVSARAHDRARVWVFTRHPERRCMQRRPVVAIPVPTLRDDRAVVEMLIARLLWLPLRTLRDERVTRRRLTIADQILVQSGDSFESRIEYRLFYVSLGDCDVDSHCGFFSAGSAFFC